MKLRTALSKFNLCLYHKMYGEDSIPVIRLSPTQEEWERVLKQFEHYKKTQDDTASRFLKTKYPLPASKWK